MISGFYRTVLQTIMQIVIGQTAGDAPMKSPTVTSEINQK